MIHRSAIFPLFIGASSLLWSLNLKSQAQEGPVAAPDAPIQLPAGRNDAFSPITVALANTDLAGAKALLLKMQADGLGPDQVMRWETLASRTAIRLGDAKWLEELNHDGNNAIAADELLTITASRLLFANRLDEAQRLLDSIKDPDLMSEIPRRRFDQLQLKIAQLQGDNVTEMKWAGKLVDFVASWDSSTCQSCHANPKASGTDVTSLDLNTWWVGERYVQLLKTSKTADASVTQYQADLKHNPNDEATKIHLAYALRAAGKDADAQKTLREIPWTVWPDRIYKKPLRFAVFP